MTVAGRRRPGLARGAACAVAAMTLAAVLATGARGAAPQPVYFFTDLAATINGQTPLVTRPAMLLMVQDGSWFLQHLHWSGWGGSAARASGVSNSSDGSPGAPIGKRITSPAKVVLSDPGAFEGHRIYRCFTLTVPAAPSADQRRCLEAEADVWVFALAAVPPTAPPTSPEFYVPLAGDVGLECQMGNTSVYCQTTQAPRSVTLGVNGAFKICSGVDCLGNAGENTPALAYGKQLEVGPFRCRSAATGVTCIVVASGRGFRMNGNGVTPVARAGAERTPGPVAGD